MKFDLKFFFNNARILRFPDEEISLGILTLSSTQRRVFTYAKTLLDKITPYEFGNDYCQDAAEEESTVTNNETKVELVPMFQ